MSGFERFNHEGGLLRDPSHRGGLLRVGRQMVDMIATAWRTFYSDGDGTVTELANGTSGYFLKSNGVSAAPSWAAVNGMLKTQNEGFKTIPTQPSAGTAVAQSASADTFGSWVEMVASTAAAQYIVGARVRGPAGGTTHQYLALSIATGAAASETEIGQIPFPGRDEGGDEGVLGFTVMLPAWIPVATGTRIACRTASSVASALAHLVTLIVVDQADVAAL